VPLFSKKSRTGERQKCHIPDASVGLLTCKSATRSLDMKSKSKVSKKRFRRTLQGRFLLNSHKILHFLYKVKAVRYYYSNFADGFGEKSGADDAIAYYFALSQDA